MTVLIVVTEVTKKGEGGGEEEGNVNMAGQPNDDEQGEIGLLS